MLFRKLHNTSLKPDSMIIPTIEPKAPPQPGSMIIPTIKPRALPQREILSFTSLDSFKNYFDEHYFNLNRAPLCRIPFKFGHQIIDEATSDRRWETIFKRRLKFLFALKPSAQIVVEMGESEILWTSDNWESLFRNYERNVRELKEAKQQPTSLTQRKDKMNPEEQETLESKEAKASESIDVDSILSSIQYYINLPETDQKQEPSGDSSSSLAPLSVFSKLKNVADCAQLKTDLKRLNSILENLSNHALGIPKKRNTPEDSFAQQVFAEFKQLSATVDTLTTTEDCSRLISQINETLNAYLDQAKDRALGSENFDRTRNIRSTLEDCIELGTKTLSFRN